MIFRAAGLVEEKAQGLRRCRISLKLERMNDALGLKIPKWPFLLVNLLSLGFAFFIVWGAPHPIGSREIILCVASVIVGAMVGALPFILEYRAFLKIVEVNALGSVAEKIQNLEKISAQINAATDHWVVLQQSVHGDAEKTTAAARQIAEKMAAEVKEFADFMQKMNDSEKATLRLELDKLKRGEAEWLQTLVRVLDHVFSLHVAAVRSGDAKFFEPIGQFQNACRGTVRRVGLTPFVAAPGEAFDVERHQVSGLKEKPPEGSVVGETVASGYTFQGRLLRPALVRLGDKNVLAEKSAEIQAAAESSTVSSAGAELPI